MTLTTQDLQAVRSLVHEEIKQEISLQLKPVNKKLDEHSQILHEQSRILKYHSKELKYLHHTANLTIE